jgi:hypothetical protein
MVNWKLLPFENVRRQAHIKETPTVFAGVPIFINIICFKINANIY